MITDVSIDNFKALKKAEINGLKRISLLSGRNNIGKSTLLEAIFLYLDHSDINSFKKLAAFRGSMPSDAEGLWKALFYQMNLDNNIRISITDDKITGILEYIKDINYLPTNLSGIAEDVLARFRANNKESFSLSYTYTEKDYTENCHFSLDPNNILRDIKTSLPGNEIKNLRAALFQNSIFIRDYNNIINGIGSLELSGEKNVLIKALKEMEPSIQDILTLSVNGFIQVYLRSAEKLLPLQYAGDGLVKLTSICLSIMQRKNGIVLIDELETGLHYSMYGKLWNMIDNISEKSNCQIIATTHSYELISAIKGNINNTEDFCYYRIGKKDDNTISYKYDYSMIDSALELEMELR